MGVIGINKVTATREKGAASFGLEFLDSLRSTQERYFADHGAYSDSMGNLDHLSSTPYLRYFTCGPIQVTPAPSPSWKIALRRKPDFREPRGLARYGAYTITYSAAGGYPTIVCDNDYCQRDLMPK